jgi:hypothetical protein
MTSAWSEASAGEPPALHADKGLNKVIFASDWPMLKERRVIPEAAALDLPPEVLDNYLYKERRRVLLRHAGGVTMDRYALRREDYSLSEDQTDLQAAYQKFFKSNCSIEVVRSAEAVGFDKSLWERLCATGATTMALPESVGGDGATLVDLTLVAEELGRSLAPVPWIDHVCAAGLLARLGALDGGGPIVTVEQIVGLDAALDSVTGARLIASGSIADQIVLRDGDDVVLLTFGTRPAGSTTSASCRWRGSIPVPPTPGRCWVADPMP